MALYQLKLVDQSLRNRWHILSQMTTLQRGETQTSTSLMAFTRSREKTSVNILVSNYTNKHITFNKGEYVGHLEPTLTDDTTTDQMEAHSTNSVTLQKMMAEQVKLDTFDPHYHKVKTSTQNKLDALLKEYKSQFAKDETSKGQHP